MAFWSSEKTSTGWPSSGGTAASSAWTDAGARFSVLGVRRWDAELTANMFSFLGKKKNQEDASSADTKGPQSKGLVTNDLSREDLLHVVCDWSFIQGFKTGTKEGGSDSLIKGEDAIQLMSTQGFLPLGIARDAAFEGRDTLFVLVRDRADVLLPTQPYLRQDIWTQLLTFVGARLPDQKLYMTLLTVDTRLLSSVIDFLFHDVHDEMETTSADEDERVETLSIDVQPGEEGIIQLARYWMRESLNRRASDMHIEPLDGSGRIRLRVNGYLETLRDRIAASDLRQMITWIKAQSKMNISERRRPLDGSIRIVYLDAGVEHSVDVRISVTPTIFGQKMVLRFLDPNLLKERSDRGLAGTIEDKDVLDKFQKALDMRDGIVLVTGPTGSGKTTTLNVALLHLLDPRKYGDTRNIVTVEDPVEYWISGANQTQVNDAAGVSFASMLRSLLRQDPDIVLVGEIRDSETAQIAVQAALTGHLILSTLHTNDALGAIPRLEDLGVSRFLVGSTLRLVQAQRLIRRLCKTCGHRKPLSYEMLEQKVDASRLRSHRNLLLAPGATVYERDGRGCNRCNFTSFDSRVAVMEVVYSTPELVSGIERKIPQVELEKIARQYSGFRPMVESGIDMVRSGLTDLGEVAGICIGSLTENE